MRTAATLANPEENGKQYEVFIVDKFKAVVWVPVLPPDSISCEARFLICKMRLRVLHQTAVGKVK